MKRKQKLVHFTHHSCLVHREAIKLDERFHTPGKPRELYTCWCDEYRRTYGGASRRPHWQMCNFARDAKQPLLTMQPAEVTCQHCIASLEAESLEAFQRSATNCRPLDERWHAERIEKWVDDRELIARAWIVCCRRFDAPAPIERREIIARLRAERAARVYRGISLAVVSGRFVTAMLSAKQISKALEQMDPADRKLMRGAVERARAADALLAKAATINESIEKLALRAAKRIKSHAAIELSPVVQ